MDPKSELLALQAKNAAIIANLKSGTNLSDSEATAMHADAERIIELKSIIARGEKNTAATAPFAAHTTDVAFPDGFVNEGIVTGRSEQKGYLTPAAVKSMAAASTAPQAKALVAGGSSATAVEFNANPLVLATPPANLGLLGVIPVVKRTTPTYSYMRQSLRQNNAAVAPSGAQKAVSLFTNETITNTLKVVAHTSEYVDSYLLSDNANLNGFLESELANGIFSKVTALAVAAFAGATGIQTQAFQGNIMDSLYLGGSKAVDLGYTPDVVLLSRANYDALMLAKDTAGNYLYRNAEDSRLGGLYPVVVTGLAANTALVLDSSKVSISTDTDGILTKWDPYTKMDFNQVRALVEGRFEFDVLAAPAIVRVSTTAV